MFGANMGKVIRFVPKSERERARLIREARAIYDSIFPPADPVSEQQDKAPVSHPVSGTNAYVSVIVAGLTRQGRNRPRHGKKQTSRKCLFEAEFNGTGVRSPLHRAPGIRIGCCKQIARGLDSTLASRSVINSSRPTRVYNRSIQDKRK